MQEQRGSLDQHGDGDEQAVPGPRSGAHDDSGFVQDVARAEEAAYAEAVARASIAERRDLEGQPEAYQPRVDHVGPAEMSRDGTAVVASVPAAVVADAAASRVQDRDGDGDQRDADLARADRDRDGDLARADRDGDGDQRDVGQRDMGERDMGERDVADRDGDGDVDRRDAELARADRGDATIVADRDGDERDAELAHAGRGGATIVAGRDGATIVADRDGDGLAPAVHRGDDVLEPATEASAPVPADEGADEPRDLMPGAVSAEPVGALWADGEADRVRDRWRELQLRFIDEPRAVADEARGVVDEVVTNLTNTLRSHKDELDAWDGDGDDTERLRAAVRRYRDFLNRLLEL